MQTSSYGQVPFMENLIFEITVTARVRLSVFVISLYSTKSETLLEGFILPFANN